MDQDDVRPSDIYICIYIYIYQGSEVIGSGDNLLPVHCQAIRLIISELSMSITPLGDYNFNEIWIQI